MNELIEVLKTFGNALIKLLIGLTVGFGVGLLTLGLFAINYPDQWESSKIYEGQPLIHLFLGIGAGLLALTAMLVLLFFSPWLKKGNPHAGSQDDALPTDYQ